LFTQKGSARRALFDELVVFHGFGSVVQTRAQNSEAQSPSRKAEKRFLVKKADLSERRIERVETKQIQERSKRETEH